MGVMSGCAGDRAIPGLAGRGLRPVASKRRGGLAPQRGGRPGPVVTPRDLPHGCRIAGMHHVVPSAVKLRAGGIAAVGMIGLNGAQPGLPRDALLLLRGRRLQA